MILSNGSTIRGTRGGSCRGWWCQHHHRRHPATPVAAAAAAAVCCCPATVDDLQHMGRSTAAPAHLCGRGRRGPDVRGGRLVGDAAEHGASVRSRSYGASCMSCRPTRHVPDAGQTCKSNERNDASMTPQRNVLHTVADCLSLILRPAVASSDPRDNECSLDLPLSGSQVKAREGGRDRRSTTLRISESVLGGKKKILSASGWRACGVSLNII